MLALSSPPSEMDYGLSLNMSKQAFHGLVYLYGVSPAVFDPITSLKFVTSSVNLVISPLIPRFYVLCNWLGGWGGFSRKLLRFVQMIF